MTNEELFANFVYEPESGFLRRINGGRLAYPWRFGGGNPGHGGQYLMTTFNGQDYYLHRLVWQYHYGVVPPRIDHADTHRENCMIENLRLCTAQQNSFNRSKAGHNTSGFKGVGRHSDHRQHLARPWFAKISVKGKVHMLGYHETPELAAAAYAVGAARIAKEFSRSN